MLVPKTEVIVTKDGERHARYVVEPGDYVIGRGADCEIIVDAELVSRRHAQLTVNYSEWLIEDLQSSNGTRVNGKPIAESVKIWPNQKIQVGSATIELRRLKEESSGDYSMAPSAAALKRILPEEFLRNKKYEIGDIVAQGGMGAILNAKEVTTERTVAMKVMLNGDSAEQLLRFIGEAKITAQLEHPNVVPLYELGIDEHEQPFYTMKFVKGVTLRSVLEKILEGDPEMIKAYPLTVLITIFQKVCDALAFAHSKGIVHRDLKPDNVMIGGYGEVLVMDWGLAKVLGQPDLNSQTVGTVVITAVHLDPNAPYTMAGAVMGTPSFMAPEQAAGNVDKIDARTDIFALGGILYNILTLQPPFTGETVDAILEKVVEARVTTPTAYNRRTAGAASNGKKIPLLHCPGGRIPEALSAVTMKALASKQLDRYQNVQTLQKDITSYQAGFATSAENAGLLRQIDLALRRHKKEAAILTVAVAFLLTGGIYAFLRVKREAVRATNALVDLKKTAPNMLALAASEARFQRFDSGLDKINSAIALDPSLTAAYWRRGWILVAEERYSEAIEALREAGKRDPSDLRSAGLLPMIEKIASVPEASRHSTEIMRPIYAKLVESGATGESTPFVRYLSQSKEQEKELVQQRLEEWLGKPQPGEKLPFKVWVNNSNILGVDISGIQIGVLEPLRGLPIEELYISGCGIKSVEPLKGMHLVKLWMSDNPIEDIGPLRGMPLERLLLTNTFVKDITPLVGAKLRFLALNGTSVTDLRPISGMPLDVLYLYKCPVADFSPLRGLPLHEIDLGFTQFSDGSILSGMPLEKLSADGARLSNLAPLAGLPLKELNLRYPTEPILDCVALFRVPTLESLSIWCDMNALIPLRGHPALREINWRESGFRSVADFWAKFDAQEAAKMK